MILRIAQLFAVCIMAVLSVMYLVQQGYFSVLSDYWRESMFAAIGVLSGWLFAITHGLRPVVAIFAATGFFLIAKMEDPSGASLVTALEGIGDRMLAVADGFTKG